MLVDRCAQAYPKLKEWTRSKQETCSAHNISNTRNHALELYKEQIARDVQSINNMPENMADKKAQAKESVFKKLKRIAPGTSAGLSAMSDEEGTVSTKPEDIARCLKQHWARYLAKRL